MNDPKRKYYHYMLESPVNEHQAQLALKLIENERVITDDSGMSNADKWDKVIKVFNAKNASLFSGIDYEEIYRDDEPRTAEAAAYICELRAQFFENLLAEQFDERYHALYIQNRQWDVRFRARVGLEHFCKAARMVYKPN